MNSIVRMHLYRISCIFAFIDQVIGTYIFKNSIQQQNNKDCREHRASDIVAANKDISCVHCMKTTHTN
jgi:hypothetical protein